MSGIVCYNKGHLHRSRNLSDYEAVKAIILFNGRRSQRYLDNLLGVKQSAMIRTVKRFNKNEIFYRTPGLEIYK